MMRKIRIWMAAMVFAGMVGGIFTAASVPQTVQAAGCQTKVLLFPTWYRGISKSSGSGCEIQSPSAAGGISKFIWTIVLNIIEMALVAVGYISAGFISYGGYLYIIGAGSADKIVAGRKTILNAVIGLVISFFSVVIVNIVVGGFS
jgi:hypothetical protein